MVRRCGSWSPDLMRSELIRVDPKRGKRAITTFKVRERYRGWTLVECQPLTDRAHQIRVHLKHKGFPIVADRLYGGRPLLLSSLKREYRLKPGVTERPLMSRVALHVQEIQIPHPVTGELKTITSELPK